MNWNVLDGMGSKENGPNVRSGAAGLNQGVVMARQSPN